MPADYCHPPKAEPEHRSPETAAAFTFHMSNLRYALQPFHYWTNRPEISGTAQEVLSGLAAVSRSHIAEIETGHTNANIETLWRISKMPGIKTSDLKRMAKQVIEQKKFDYGNDWMLFHARI